MVAHGLYYEVFHRWSDWLPVVRASAHLIGYPVAYPMGYPIGCPWDMPRDNLRGVLWDDLWNVPSHMLSHGMTRRHYVWDVPW